MRGRFPYYEVHFTKISAAGITEGVQHYTDPKKAERAVAKMRVGCTRKTSIPGVTYYYSKAQIIPAGIYRTFPTRIQAAGR